MINSHFLFQIFVLILFNSSYSYGQNHFRNDLEKMNLRGNVKSLTKIMYKVFTEDGVIKKGDNFNFLGIDITSNEKFIFNEDGNINQLIRYKIDGNPYHIRIQKFDKNGKLKRIEVKGIHPFVSDILYNSEGDTIQIFTDYESMSDMKEVFYYNALGKIIQSNLLNLSDSTENIISFKKYNRKGMVVEHTSMEIDGALFNQKKFDYDEVGNILLIKRYDYSNINLIYKAVYKYHENGILKEIKYYNKVRYGEDEYLLLNHIKRFNLKGQQIEWEVYNMDRTVEHSERSKYDEFGNEVVKNRIDNENKIYIKYFFKYDFDSESNWIKKIIYYDEIPKYIIEREIEYYE